MFARFCIVALAVLTLAAKEPLDVEGLRTALREHVSNERFAAATWGIKIKSIDTGAILFETNSGKLLKPASNAKLYTGALALDRFGTDYRIRTSLFSAAAPAANGVLASDLVIYGRGDPSLSARFNNGNYSNLFAPLIAEIKRAGVRSIAGALIGDESFFTGPRLGSGWTWDDLQYYYGAEVSALSFQDNVVDLFIRPGAKTGEAARVELKPATDYLRLIERPLTVASNGVSEVTVTRPLDSPEVRIGGTIALGKPVLEEAVTVPDPALWFVTSLRQALATEGIAVRGPARTARVDRSKLKELGAIDSRPLSEILEKMVKPSQNLYAQLLLLQVGAAEKGTLNTEDRGIRALRRFLEKARIDPDEVLLEEGSGLSRSCLVTPNATVALLEFMARHPHAATFEQALPEPGEGTLRRRLPELRGRLRAKTGSLRYVNTLSGYLTTTAGERLAFSIMLNAYNPPPGAASREDLDTIPRLTAALSQRTK